MQIRYQMQKMKGYSKTAFSILKEYYEKMQDNETLQAICVLLMKGNRTDKDSFLWYSLGVEQELRITKLYEYYMMSLPKSKRCQASIYNTGLVHPRLNCSSKSAHRLEGLLAYSSDKCIINQAIRQLS